MTDSAGQQDRHQDLEDPRTAAAQEIKRRREADSAASGPSGGGDGGPALGEDAVTSDGTAVSPGDEAARPAGAPTPPPGAGA